MCFTAIWARSSSVSPGTRCWCAPREICRDIQGVREVVPHNNAVKLVLDDRTTPQDVFKALAASDTVVNKFEIAIPSLDEIFIQVVEGGEMHE